MHDENRKKKQRKKQKCREGGCSSIQGYAVSKTARKETQRRERALGPSRLEMGNREPHDHRYKGQWRGYTLRG